MLLTFAGPPGPRRGGGDLHERRAWQFGAVPERVDLASEQLLHEVGGRTGEDGWFQTQPVGQTAGEDFTWSLLGADTNTLSGEGAQGAYTPLFFCNVRERWFLHKYHRPCV